VEEGQNISSEDGSFVMTAISPHAMPTDTRRNKAYCCQVQKQNFSTPRADSDLDIAVFFKVPDGRLRNCYTKITANRPVTNKATGLDTSQLHELQSSLI
jgi:hypothetical protein